MIKSDEKSNAQSWELEVTCKNKEYLDAVVGAILKRNTINFEVENIDVTSSYEKFNGRYLVLIWSSWFSNLKDLVKDLAKIERNLD